MAIQRQREIAANVAGHRQGTVPIVTPTAFANTTTPANPAALASMSWLETAVAILQAFPTALTALQIVAIARATGCNPRSRTCTPAQSVNRDVRAAVRRGDPRVVLGPGAGQFSGTASTGAPNTPIPTSRIPSSAALRLPIGPLASLIAAHGGLRACGVRHQPGDTIERIRWVARLQRAYLRARRRGWIGVVTADELAVEALRLHPSEVWGAYWWDACCVLEHREQVPCPSGRTNLGSGVRDSGMCAAGETDRRQPPPGGSPQ